MTSNASLHLGAIGIDFGSSRSVIAVAKKGGVDVIANEASLRETRNIVGYGPIQRYSGESANAQAKSNFKNTIPFFNRLLGVPANHPIIRDETKWISSKVGTNAEGKLVHEVTFKGKNHQLLPEQVTAAMIGDLRNIIKMNQLQNHEAVISVPSYYTEAERKALKDACIIAGLNPLRLFNESSAICLSYGLFRKQELDTAPRHVAFVDFGHSKFSCFIGSFTKEKLSIASQIHERSLGVRDMDWEIYKHFSAKFEKQFGLSVSESKKGQLRLLDAIEKMRKILSGNNEADCNCEYLVEDCDLNETLTREEFEKLAEPVLARIQKAIDVVVKEAKEKNIFLHSVEIVGGAARIPAVQNIIQQSFGVDHLNKTLNQSEVIARGCAMMCAMSSPQFKVSQYLLEEANYYPIKMSWDFFNTNEKGEKMEQEGKTSTIFDKGCTIPNLKSITFNKNDGINLSIFYAEPPLGFDALLSTITVAPCKPTEKEFGVKLKLKLDKDGLTQLEEAHLIEDYTVEEKIPVKKDKPAVVTPPTAAEGAAAQATTAPVDPTQDYEIKLKKKTRHTDLTLESVSSLYQLNKKDLQQLTDVQTEHHQSDDLITNTLNTKNELEAFVYAWRSKLETSHKPYATVDTLAKIQTQLNENETWLYGEGEDTTLVEYTKRLENLQAQCVPINRRYLQYTNLPQSISDIKNALSLAEQFFISQDEKFAHISKEDRKPVADEIDKIRIWLNNADSAQKSLQTFVDPAITCEEVNAHILTLSNVYNSVASKPKPAPKKEEKPATETANNTQPENDSSKMDIEK